MAAPKGVKVPKKRGQPLNPTQPLKSLDQSNTKQASVKRTDESSRVGPGHRDLRSRNPSHIIDVPQTTARDQQADSIQPSLRKRRKYNHDASVGEETQNPAATGRHPETGVVLDFVEDDVEGKASAHGETDIPASAPNPPRTPKTHSQVLRSQAALRRTTSARQISAENGSDISSSQHEDDRTFRPSNERLEIEQEVEERQTAQGSNDVDEEGKEDEAGELGETQPGLESRVQDNRGATKERKPSRKKLPSESESGDTEEEGPLRFNTFGKDAAWRAIKDAIESLNESVPLTDIHEGIIKPNTREAKRLVRSALKATKHFEAVAKDESSHDQLNRSIDDELGKIEVAAENMFLRRTKLEDLLSDVYRSAVPALITLLEQVLTATTKYYTDESDRTAIAEAIWLQDRIIWLCEHVQARRKDTKKLPISGLGRITRTVYPTLRDDIYKTFKARYAQRMRKHQKLEEEIARQKSNDEKEKRLLQQREENTKDVAERNRRLQEQLQRTEEMDRRRFQNCQFLSQAFANLQPEQLHQAARPHHPPQQTAQVRSEDHVQALDDSDPHDSGGWSKEEDLDLLELLRKYDEYDCESETDA
ncbi:hypothetical protein MMC25_003459 [Agyrium rufum]|nr:hypothetical protein [Agyrium rufum]